MRHRYELRPNFISSRLWFAFAGVDYIQRERDGKYGYGGGLRRMTDFRWCNHVLLSPFDTLEGRRLPYIMLPGLV